MKIIKNKQEFSEFILKIKDSGKKIGLIPTMGSIHKGHISLVKKSKKLNCFSIVTIFINPAQFNNKNDYFEYPRNYEQDINSLKKIDTDLVFLPTSKDIYPKGVKIKKTIFDYRNILCDKFRPGHFDGVTTVVKLLFDLVDPNYAFFGEKDYQQLKIIQKLTEDNNLRILIKPCASIRMLNGLSFSSRYNNFSSHQEIIFKNVAKQIMISVFNLRKKIDIKILKNLTIELKKLNIKKIDYLEIRDEKNLLPSLKNKKSRLFLAFYINEIRIIDNFILY